MEVTVSGNRYIQNIIDRYTGYVVSIPCPSIGKFQTVWNLINYWITRFGIPLCILSDNGKDFCNDFITDLCDILGINHKKIVSYMSPTNGSVERYNRTLTTALWKLATENKIDMVETNHATWDLFIQIISGAHNNRVTRRNKYSPNQLVLGKNIRLPTDLQIRESAIDYDDLYKGYMDNVRRVINDDAKANLEVYDEKRKAVLDEKRRDHKQSISDKVIWWKGTYPALGKEKYRIHWRGPFIIKEIWNQGRNVTLENMRTGDKFNTNVSRIRNYNEVWERQNELGNEEEEKE